MVARRSLMVARRLLMVARRLLAVRVAVVDRTSIVMDVDRGRRRCAVGRASLSGKTEIESVAADTRLVAKPTVVRRATKIAQNAAAQNATVLTVNVAIVVLRNAAVPIGNQRAVTSNPRRLPASTLRNAEK